MYYSSGMHTRLGFSIAAHLDPDVLIIDEALAVGDAAFQRKAVDRIYELVRGDIPLVVVSHQLETIASLCNQAILLAQGAVVRQGTPEECITAYVGGEGVAAPPENAMMAIGIHRLQLEPAGPVPSGGRLVCALKCTVSERGTAGSESVGIRLRSQPWRRPRLRDQRAGAGPGAASQWPLHRPARTAAQRAAGDLSGGELRVELHGRPPARRQLAAGPVGAVEVRGGPGFHGTVQMNPAIRVAREDHP